MAEVDPFGRAAGEDPIADMGWSTEGVSTTPQAADVAAPERRGRRPRRRGNAGCAFAVVVVGFLIAVFAVVVPAVLSTIDEVEQGIEEAIPTVPAPPAPDSPRPPADSARAPGGLERASLLRRGNLAPALQRLRRMTRSSRVSLIRIDAQQVLVTVFAGGGRTRLAEATWDGEARVLSTSPGGGTGSSFPWSAVDASAPDRIVRAATRGRSARSFDYLVLLEAAGLRWSAFLKGGGVFSAAPDGTAVSRVG